MEFIPLRIAKKPFDAEYIVKIIVTDIIVVDASSKISFTMTVTVGDTKEGTYLMKRFITSSALIGKNLSRVNKNIKNGNRDINVKNAACAEKDAT